MRSMMMTVLLAMTLLVPASMVHAKGKGNPTGAKGSKFATNHPRRNEVNKRVDNQRSRINQGVKSGKMTKAQAQQDRSQLHAIKAQEHAEVKANGGHLTKGEQKQINKEENGVSKEIHEQKNGGQ